MLEEEGIQEADLTYILCEKEDLIVISCVRELSESFKETER